MRPKTTAPKMRREDRDPSRTAQARRATLNRRAERRAKAAIRKGAR